MTVSNSLLQILFGHWRDRSIYAASVQCVW